MAACEIWQEFAAAKMRTQDETARDLVHAWQAVRIYVLTENKRRLPDVRQLLKELDHHATSSGRPSQTLAEQRTTLQALSLVYGLPLRKGMKRRVLQPHEAKAVSVKPVIKKRAVKKVRHR